jgi:hypothetical protein
MNEKIDLLHDYKNTYANEVVSKVSKCENTNIRAMKDLFQKLVSLYKLYA